MSNRNIEMEQITTLIAVWISKIRLKNLDNYYDINKLSEHLCRQLLNKMYGHELIDLNEEKSHFPGLDIGDKTKDLIAYQVTSRTDRKKIIENLETVVKNKFEATFTGGIKFLILNDTSTVSFGPKAKKTPTGILPSFKIEDDIIYPHTLIKKIEDIYEKDADLIKFNQIKNLLEKEIIPLISGKKSEAVEAKIDQLTSMLTQALGNIVEKGPELNISAQFFHGNLQPPAITIASDRTELVESLSQRIKELDAVWLQSAPSTGKTTLAALLAKKSPQTTLWIECRDVRPEQLIEHILSLHSHYLKLKNEEHYSEMLESIFSSTESDTLIILNDLPNLQGHSALQDYLGQYLSKAATKNISVVVTSNYIPPERLSTVYDVNLEIVLLPPFEDKDTEAVLQSLGASKETSDLLSGLITQTTQGHPLLIQSAGKFLQGNDWKVDKQTISTIFSGKFGDEADKEIYNRIIEHTTDSETRELLYRLRCVIGSFSFETIQRLSTINPAITHPAEKINQLLGIWLQNSTEKAYQLSPLIKSLDGNLTVLTEKETNNQLGREIIEKKSISQTDASTAILYFKRAEEYNQAAFVLLKVLNEFVRTPELFFDWGFQLHWFYEPLPENVLSIIKVQIRVFQINICLQQKEDTAFLSSDLQMILTKEDPGMLGHALGEMMFFQLNLPANPLAAMRHLAKMQHALNEVAKVPIETNEPISNPELINGIWVIFSLLNKAEEYEEWFHIYKTLQISPEIIDAHSNDMYITAGVSIYRNAVLKNKGSEVNIVALLQRLCLLSEENGLYLISVYALKYLAKFLAEDNNDIASATKLVIEHEHIWNIDPIYKFLFFTEMGSINLSVGDMQAATHYLSDVRSIDIPDAYTEKLDYLIASLQVSHHNKQADASLIAHEALAVALRSNNYALEDKVKLYGESAIGLVNESKLSEALNLYSEGYTLLLNNFTNNEEQQALVIRYGNAVKYIGELLEADEAKSFGEGKNVIPEPGHFYHTNERLLADGRYFEERKFMVATILQSSYESIGDIVQAKHWAYKSIELGQELQNAKFKAILQSYIHFLIQDKQYRQAYNLMAHIEAYYAQLKQKFDSGELVDEKVKQSLQQIKQDDFTIYFFILLPIALSFSLDICESRIAPEKYPQLILEAFSSEKYVLHDPTAFAFAKTIFHEIMVNRISYAQMQELFSSYTGEKKDIIYMIGCLLLSSFTGATEAAELQLAVLVELDKTTRGMKALYRYLFVPFFEGFWKQKLITHGHEFTGKDHLQSKGFQLIAKSNLDHKVRTIFRVICDHLNVRITSTQRDYIDGD